MGTQGFLPQPIADSVGPAGGKAGQHLWATSPPQYLCAPTTNGKGGASPSANGRWGATRCPHSPANRDRSRPRCSLSLSLPTPPPPAQWRAGRGRHPRGAAREARARRPRPANGRTCSIELAPLLPRRRWKRGRGGGGRSEQGRPPSHHPASHDNGAAASRRPHRTTCLGEGGGRGCALKGAGGQSRTAAPAGSPAPGAGYP